MLNDFLKEVVSIVVGKNAEEIANLLNTKKHVNEFLIAKKLDITINQTRNILYKLSDYGLVSSIRKKDKKKGWYTYFWRIEISKALEFLKEIRLKQAGRIRDQIHNREAHNFYVCERCKLEFDEQQALLMDFTCNECGDVFSRKDNTKLLRELKKNLDRVEKEISLIEEEIGKETSKIEKEREKEAKKEAAKKKAAKKKKKVVKKKVKKKKPAKKKIVKKKAVKKKIKKPVKKKKQVKKPKKKAVKKVKKKTKGRK